MERYVTVVAGGKAFSIDRDYADYSPFLAGFINFSDNTGKDIVVKGISASRFHNYTQFLYGNPFTMDSEDENIFAYMGHPNHLGYPLDYWKLKLVNRWIRDNFYRYKLYDKEDGLYGLTEIDGVMDIRIYYGHFDYDYDRTGMVIAGGAALYSTGIIKSVYDIDFFTTNKTKSIDVMQRLNNGPLRYRNLTMNTLALYKYVEIVNEITSSRELRPEMMKISLIRREYTCPAEVVHGFDLDASQFVIINRNGSSKLYTTDLGLYVLNNRAQWFDPDMGSTTYLERLAKYVDKGIQMRLPSMSRANISGRNIRVRSPYLALKDLVRMLNPSVDNYDTIKERARALGIPRDVGSILILISYFGLTSGKIIRVLLSNDLSHEDRRAGYDKQVETLSYGSKIDPTEGWIVVNPMQQERLSGIIYPESFEDLMTMYENSPLYTRTD